MRRQITAVALFVLLSGSIHAEALDLKVHGGFTTVSMVELNKENAAQWGWEGYGPYRGLDSGFVVGLDALTNRLTPANWLDLGLRAEYLQTNLAENTSPKAGNDDSYTDQGNMVSVLLGASTSAPVVKGLELGLGVWAGLGYATMDQKVGWNNNTIYPNGTGTFSNGVFTSMPFVAELESSIKYKFNSHWGLDFTGGWRWANAGTMLDSNGTPLYASLPLWERGFKDPVNVDYSGATAQGSVNFGF